MPEETTEGRPTTIWISPKDADLYERWRTVAAIRFRGFSDLISRILNHRLMRFYLRWLEGRGAV